MPAMVETGDHGIANLEIQCKRVESGENNDHPRLDTFAADGNTTAVGSDTNSLNNGSSLDPTATMGVSSSSNPPPLASFNAKHSTGSEFQSQMLPSTTSTTESTTTTAAMSDGFLSVASSTVNVTGTVALGEAPGTGPTGSHGDDPQLENNKIVTIPPSMVPQTEEKLKAQMMTSSVAAPADTEPLDQSTMSPPQALVDENEKKEGIQETVAAQQKDPAADQANSTAGQQEGQSQEQALQLQEEKEKLEAKSRKDDASIDTPPIPLEVSSHVNQDNSEYDEGLEFDASDDSSEGQLSSDDEEDYTIDPNFFQMGENEPMIIIGVPSMQDTEPSQ